MAVSPALVDAVRTAVTDVAGDLTALSHAIAADPELAYEEHRAAGRVADALEAGGLAVERGAYGLDTALVARAGTRGPHVVVCAEYDALPGIGHACGHNVIAGAGVGAGIALARVADQAGLRVTVLGTPAEERYGGKVELLRAGAFDGADAAMMIHPAPYDDHIARSLAIADWRVAYTGRAAHASAYPWLGINALDAVIAGYNAISMLRQHLRPGQQIHGIVSDGGQAPNIVPEHAEARYYLRAISADDLADLEHRVRACLDGAATATGATLEVEEEGNAYEPLDPHPDLAAAFTRACESIGREFTPRPDGSPSGSTAGSTDMGNVSQRLPSIHPMLSVGSWPAVNHQAAFAEHCATPAADRTLLDGATAMALTALALAADPALVA